MGNVTYVTSTEGVVVFDGGGLPAMAEQVIAKIQSETSLPVTHVVISHWHGDHAFGIHPYLEAFPNVQVIAHSFTDAVMHSKRIRYIDGYPTFIERNLPRFTEALETDLHPDGNPVTGPDRLEYERIVNNADAIDEQYKQARITPPTIVMGDELTIVSGNRTIQLMKLGHGNTEGDIVMWLPEARVVAAGDLVVYPSPYAFNVPPRPWAESLRNLNALDYSVLVPGHGAVQHDTAYVDLLIEAAESIADQRDTMVAEGLSHEEIEAALDFADYEQRMTGGDEFLAGFYEGYFETPFRKAATKALTGEPMVEVIPDDEPQ